MMTQRVAAAQGEVMYGPMGMKNEDGVWTHYDEMDHVTISRKIDEKGKSKQIVVDKTERREKGKLETVRNVKMSFDDNTGRLLSASFYKRAPAEVGEGKNKHLENVFIESGVNFRNNERWLREFLAKVEGGKEAVYQGRGMEKNAGGWFAEDPGNREMRIERGRDYTRIDVAMNGKQGWTDETVVFDKEGKVTQYKFSSRRTGVVAEFDTHEEEQRVREFRANPDVVATDVGLKFKGFKPFE